MQVTDLSPIQAQNERVSVAQRLFDPNATALEKIHANRAIAQLFEDNQSTVRFYQRQFSGLDRAAAYSAILDGFHFAIRTFQTGVAQFKTWFARKAKYKLLDLCKGRKSDFADLDLLLSNGFDLFSRPPAPESEELEQVRAAIASLPDKTQRIIALFTQGYSWVEIGAMFGQTDAAVRMNYNRAVKDLRKQFMPEPTAQTETVQDIPAVPTPLHWMAGLKLRGCRVRNASKRADRRKVVSTSGAAHGRNVSSPAFLSSSTLAQTSDPDQRDCPCGHDGDAGLSCGHGRSLHAAALRSHDLCHPHHQQILGQNTEADSGALTRFSERYLCLGRDDLSRLCPGAAVQ